MALVAPVAPVSLSAPEPVAPTPELEGPTLALAPMQKYMPATLRSIQPVPPPVQILGVDSGPRITLPGPTLPPELTRLQDASLATVLGEKTETRVKEAVAPAQTASSPSWGLSILVAILLLAAALGAFYYLVLPRTVADAKPAPVAAEPATTPAPGKSTGPLAKFIEGHRFPHRGHQQEVRNPIPGN